MTWVTVTELSKSTVSTNTQTLMVRREHTTLLYLHVDPATSGTAHFQCLEKLTFGSDKNNFTAVCDSVKQISDYSELPTCVSSLIYGSEPDITIV